MAAFGKAKRTVPIPLPDAVAEVGAALRGAGGRCWVVGGAVRDVLLGLPIGDWDLVTDLHPARVQEVLGGRADAHLGTWSRPLADGGEVTVTTLRREADYRDHRRPERVEFVTDPAIDARRRDFTVNALYQDPVTGGVHDPTGGLEDLDHRRLRVIGDPLRRLAEDPLRLLRAVRFAARCGLGFEEGTGRALGDRAGELRHLAVERVYEELTRVFRGPGRGRGLRLLVETGLAAVVLPEVVPMAGVPQPPRFHPEGDVLTHVCLVLDHVREGDPVQAWSAVLHDVGKPATFERAPDRIRFTGHDVVSAAMAEKVLTRLRAPRELRETVVEVCRDHIRFASLPQMRKASRERWLRSPRFPAHLAFHRADCLGSHGDLGIYQAARTALAELPLVPPPPVVSGRDVLAAGVPEGPMVGRVLRRLQARAEAEGLEDRPSVLALLPEVVAECVKDPGGDGR